MKGAEMSEPEAARPWRLKLSLRSFLVLISVMCAYLACWTPTVNVGVPDVSRRADLDAEFLLEISSVAPLVVEVRGVDGFTNLWMDTALEERRDYYFWCFGYVARLPYHRKQPIEEEWSAWAASPVRWRNAIRPDSRANAVDVSAGIEPEP